MKGAATDMFYLTLPRHISTLPFASISPDASYFRSSLMGTFSVSIGMSKVPLDDIADLA